MKTKRVFPLLLLGCLLPGTLAAAEKPAPPISEKPAVAEPAPSTPPASNNAAPATSTATNPTATKVPEGVQSMAQDFGEKSKDVLEKNKAIRDRLSSAKTEEERRKIIAELRQQQQQRIDRQREIARNIREQMQSKRRGDTAVGIAVGP